MKISLSMLVFLIAAASCGKKKDVEPAATTSATSNISNSSSLLLADGNATMLETGGCLAIFISTEVLLVGIAEFYPILIQMAQKGLAAVTVSSSGSVSGVSTVTVSWLVQQMNLGAVGTAKNQMWTKAVENVLKVSGINSYMLQLGEAELRKFWATVEWAASGCGKVLEDYVTASTAVLAWASTNEPCNGNYDQYTACNSTCWGGPIDQFASGRMPPLQLKCNTEPARSAIIGGYLSAQKSWCYETYCKLKNEFKGTCLMNIRPEYFPKDSPDPTSYIELGGKEQGRFCSKLNKAAAYPK